jgi:hypothetical protein
LKSIAVIKNVERAAAGDAGESMMQLAAASTLQVAASTLQVAASTLLVHSKHAWAPLQTDLPDSYM